MLYSCLPWKHHRAADISSIWLARVRWCSLHSSFVSTHAYVRQWLEQLLGRGLQNLSKKGPWVCEKWRFCGILLSSWERKVAWVCGKQLWEGPLSRVSHYPWICPWTKLGQLLGWSVQDLRERETRRLSHLLTRWNCNLLPERSTLGGTASWPWVT